MSKINWRYFGRSSEKDSEENLSMEIQSSQQLTISIDSSDEEEEDVPKQESLVTQQDPSQSSPVKPILEKEWAETSRRTEASEPSLEEDEDSIDDDAALERRMEEIRKTVWSIEKEKKRRRIAPTPVRKLSPAQKMAAKKRAKKSPSPQVEDEDEGDLYVAEISYKLPKRRKPSVMKVSHDSRRQSSSIPDETISNRPTNPDGSINSKKRKRIASPRRRKGSPSKAFDREKVASEHKRIERAPSPRHRLPKRKVASKRKSKLRKRIMPKAPPPSGSVENSSPVVMIDGNDDYSAGSHHPQQHKSRASPPLSDPPETCNVEFLRSHCWDCHVRLKELDGQSCLYALHVHPLLKVPVCCVCAEEAAYTMRRKTFEDDEEGPEACSGCGVDDGVQLYLCDMCPLGFCAKCVVQANGNEGRGKKLTEQLNDNSISWACIACCPPVSLSKLQVTDGLEGDADDEGNDEGAEGLVQKLQQVEEALLECDKQDHDEERNKQAETLRTELSRDPELSTEEVEERVKRDLDALESQWDNHHTRLQDCKTDLLEKLNRLGISDRAFYDFYSKSAPSTFEAEGSWRNEAEKEMDAQRRKEDEEVKAIHEDDLESSEDEGQDDSEARALMEVEDLVTEEEFKASLKSLRRRRTCLPPPSKAQVREALLNDQMTLDNYQVDVEYVNEKDDDEAVKHEEDLVSGRSAKGVRIRRDELFAMTKSKKVREEQMETKPPSANRNATEDNQAETTLRPLSKVLSRQTTEKHRAHVHGLQVSSASTKRRPDSPVGLAEPSAAKTPQDDFEGSTFELYSDEGKQVSVAASLAKILKDHQKDGIKFMWRNTFLDLPQIKSKTEVDEGTNFGGCILAHHMGLGKTLQVITLLHTAMYHPTLRIDTEGEQLIRRVLLVVPLNTVANWENELEMWTSKLCHRFNIFNLQDAMWERARLKLIEQWSRSGGILLTGSALLSKIVSTAKEKAEQGEQTGRSTSQGRMLMHYLQRPGPDVVVLDEAHTMLKNKDAKTFKALSGIRTKRRIVMTGTPVQNNLKEYYNMASWVRPGCLGSERCFTRDFIDPIMTGMTSDAKDEQVAHQVQSTRLLVGKMAPFMQRKSSVILAKQLPPLQQVVLFIRQSKLQARLYSAFKKHLNTMKQRGQTMRLLEHYQKMRPVNNHPYCCLMPKRSDNPSKNRKSKSILLRDDAIDSDSERIQQRDHKPTNEKSSDVDCTQEAWMEPIQKEVSPDDVEHGGKVFLLLQILAQAQSVGDKVVVFSQCLRTLDFIERVLACKDWGKYVYKRDELSTEVKLGGWKRNVDYLRIDGAVGSSERGDLIKNFEQQEAFAFLISIQAGGIGVNLTVANRVVIFDNHWNPSVTNQALHRCYRYNQTKPVFGYRFVAERSMEEKIFSRSVNKSGLAERVVDLKFPERYFSVQELNELQAIDDWAQCDLCDKWRMLFGENSDNLKDDEWFCSMNNDVLHKSCDVPERTREWYSANRQNILTAMVSSSGQPIPTGEESGERASSESKDVPEELKKDLIRKDEILFRLGFLEHSEKLKKQKERKGRKPKPVDIVSKIRFHDHLLAASEEDLEIEASHEDAHRSEVSSEAIIEKSRNQTVGLSAPITSQRTEGTTGEQSNERLRFSAPARQQSFQENAVRSVLNAMQGHLPQGRNPRISSLSQVARSSALNVFRSAVQSVTRSLTSEGNTTARITSNALQMEAAKLLNPSGDAGNEIQTNEQRKEQTFTQTDRKRGRDGSPLRTAPNVPYHFENMQATQKTDACSNFRGHPTDQQGEGVSTTRTTQATKLSMDSLSSRDETTSDSYREQTLSDGQTIATEQKRSAAGTKPNPDNAEKGSQECPICLDSDVEN